MSIDFLTNCLTMFAKVFIEFPVLYWVLAGAIICSLTTVIRYIVGLNK